jgi:hypothetical protein
MANPGQTIAGLVMAAAMLTAPAAAATSGTERAEVLHAHLRPLSPAIGALIARASEGSATFRGLVGAVNASDGIVFIQEGDCIDYAHACFVGVTMVGSSRALWVRVNVKLGDDDLDVMGSIAHELRHTLEVLASPSVTSTVAMLSFYRWAGFSFSARGYETHEAIDAGNAVRTELRTSARRPRAN